jgi:hypothetical protein
VKPSTWGRLIGGVWHLLATPASGSAMVCMSLAALGFAPK